MTGVKSHSAPIHTFPDTARLARHLARLADVSCAEVAVHRFPDGETLVRVGARLPARVVLVRSLPQPDAKIVETLLAADALRRAGARRVTLVAPYLPYMRQDTVFHPGEPISQRVVGAVLGQAFDSVLTVEAHLHRISRLSEVCGRGSRSFSAAPVIAEWLRGSRDDTLVIGPDAESEPWIRAIARRARLPWMVGHKRRLGDRRVAVELPSTPVARRAVVVDDVASSGVTLAVASRALRRHGVEHVDAAVVHAVFAPGAEARIRAAGVRRLVSCDTIPHPTNAIPTAPLLVQSLRRELG